MEPKECQHEDKYIQGFIKNTKWCPIRKNMLITSQIKCTKCGKTWVGIAYKTDELRS